MGAPGGRTGGSTWGPSSRVSRGAGRRRLRPVRSPASTEHSRDGTPASLGPSRWPRASLHDDAKCLHGVKARIEVVSLETGSARSWSRTAPTPAISLRPPGLHAAGHSDGRTLRSVAARADGPAGSGPRGRLPGAELGMRRLNSGAAQFTVSDSGLLAYAPGASSRTRRSSCFSWTRTAAPSRCPASTGRWSARSYTSHRTAAISPSPSSIGAGSCGSSTSSVRPSGPCRRGHRRVASVEPGRDAAGGGLGGSGTVPPLDRAHSRSGRLAAPHRGAALEVEPILEPRRPIPGFRTRRSTVMGHPDPSVSRTDRSSPS